MLEGAPCIGEGNNAGVKLSGKSAEQCTGHAYIS